MATILIVDDMAFIRQLIALSLRREGYQTICAAHGREALKKLHEGSIDLVLLDVNMPVMDGLSCLKAIRAHPTFRATPVIMLSAAADRKILAQTMRLGISGYTLKSESSFGELAARVEAAIGHHEHAIAESIPESEQPAEKVSSTVKRAGNLDAKTPPCQPLDRNEVLAKVCEEAKLRAAPAIWKHVMHLTRSSRSTFDDVADAVRNDQAIAVRVMRLANSSYFGVQRKAQTLSEAAVRIGMNGIRDALGTVLMIEHFSANWNGSLIPQRFWEHSLATAVLTGLIVRQVERNKEEAEHLFLAGLLHDVGRLALAAVYPYQYSQVIETGVERNVDLLDVEKEMFHVTHAEVTQMLLEQWETPADICEAAATHELSAFECQRTAKDSTASLIVALANRLAHTAVLGDSGNPMLTSFGELAAALGLNGKAIGPIVQGAAKQAAEMSALYASRTDEELRVPLASELSVQAKARGGFVVLAKGAPGFTLSLFFDRLGWLTTRNPRHAVLFASSENTLIANWNEIPKYEKGNQERISVVVASPNGNVAPPSGLAGNRQWVNVKFPGRYPELIEKVRELTNEPRQERPLGHVAVTP